VRIKSIFEAHYFSNNVVVKVPVPKTTANVKVYSSGVGKAKYEPESSAIMWRFKRFQGDSESLLTADVQLIPSKKRESE